MANQINLKELRKIWPIKNDFMESVDWMETVKGAFPARFSIWVKAVTLHLEYPSRKGLKNAPNSIKLGRPEFPLHFYVKCITPGRLRLEVQRFMIVILVICFRGSPRYLWCVRSRCTILNLRKTIAEKGWSKPLHKRWPGINYHEDVRTKCDQSSAGRFAKHRVGPYIKTAQQVLRFERNAWNKPYPIA